MRRFRASVLTVAALICLAGTLNGAAARPGDAGKHRAEAARATVDARRAAAERLNAEERKFGIRAPELYDENDPTNYSIETPYVLVQGGTTGRAQQSKVQFSVPPSLFLIYDRFCGKSQGFDENGKSFYSQVCCPNITDTVGCRPDAVVTPPRTSTDNAPFDPATNSSISWTRNDGPVWAASPPGSSRPYGIFPSFKVDILAFGAVPATATVHLSQPVRPNGQVVPFDFLDLYLNPGYRVGTKVDGFPYPLTGDENGATSVALYYTRTLSGPVNVRISDVKIDGRSVDVGASCSATSARLVYNGPRGLKEPSLPATEVPGRPGEFDPLSPDAPGTGHGSVTIGRFDGCRDGARSLDPLVTALVSGTNPVTLRLRSGISDCTEANAVGGCPDFPGYDGPIARQPQAAHLAKVAAKLPATAARRFLVSVPRTLQPAVRSALRSIRAKSGSR